MPQPPPVIPAREWVYYAFQFADWQAYTEDRVLATYFPMELLLYLADVDSVTPFAGAQAMVAKPGPIIDELWFHPNLLFALDMVRSPNVLFSLLTPQQMKELIVIQSNFGTFAISGTLNA